MRRYILTILLFSFSLLADASQWKYICYEPGFLRSAFADTDWGVTKTPPYEPERLKYKSYGDEDFLDTLQKHISSVPCWAKDQLSFAEKQLNLLKSSFDIGMHYYNEKWKFTIPQRMARASLSSQSKPSYYLFEDDKGYLACKICDSSISRAESSFSINVGKKHVALPKYTLFLSGVHELGHVQQNNIYQISACKGVDHWISEGIADSLAIKVTQDYYKKEYFGPYSNKYYKRFFLSRSYALPLNYKDPDTLLGYRTNGFWDFITRHYLKEDPKQYEKLYAKFNNTTLNNQTDVVHTFLDSIDGEKSQGLKHIFPQFLAAFSTWYERFDKKRSEKEWISGAFDGPCEKITLSLSNPLKKTSVDIASLAGKCIDIEVAQAQQSVQDRKYSIHLEADSPSSLITDELYVSMAEMRNVFTPMNCAKRLKQAENKAGTCLLDPKQSMVESNLARYWSTGSFQAYGKKDAFVRLILSRVPHKLKDINEGTLPTEKIDLHISLTSSSISYNGGEAQNANFSVNPLFAPTAGMHQNIPTKDANSLSDLSKINVNALVSDTMKGRFIKPPPMSDIFAKGIRTMSIDAGNSTQSFNGGLILEKPVFTGMTGTFNGIAMFGIIPHNTALPTQRVMGEEKMMSSITFSRNDVHMIQYSGTLRGYVIGEDGELTKEQKSVDFEGSLSFGGRHTGKEMITEYITSDYEAYRDVILAPVSSAMGDMMKKAAKELEKVFAKAKEAQKRKKTIAKNTWFKATITGDLNASFSKSNRRIKLACKTKGFAKIFLLDTGRGAKHQFKLGIPYSSFKPGKFPLADLTNNGNIPINTASIIYVYSGLLGHSALQSLTRKYSKNLKGYLNITNVPKKKGEYFQGEIIAEASIKNLPEKTVNIQVSFSLPMNETQLKSCIP